MSEPDRDPLPSLYAQEGYLSFSAIELWELVKGQISAADLAEALWAESGDVRDRFRDLVLRKWDSFTDPERRAMMAALSLHVHNKALDEAVTKMARIEGAASDAAYKMNARQTFDNYLRFIKETLAEIAPEALAEVERRHGVNPFASLDSAVKEEQRNNVVGPLWREAREHWRARAEALFLAPPEPDALEPKVSEVLF